MPRILPRLVRAWNKLRDSTAKSSPPVPPPKRFQRIPGRRLPASRALASLDVRNRTHSLLLDPKNVVQNEQHYVYRKSHAPKVYGSTLARPKLDRVRDAYGPRVRAMTKEERQWYANPYLRMLASPMRQDNFSHRVMPRDFMIRFATVRVLGPRSSAPTQAFVPDLMEHPRYRSQIGRKSHYVVCNKAILQDFEERQTWRRLATCTVFNVPYFEARMGHLLRVRVLQELELLAQRLQTRPHRATDRPVMRRLTRAEYKRIQKTGIIPFENAVAVLVVPPLNKNPATKQRPIPSSSPQPVQEDDRPLPNRPLPPVCVMHHTAKEHIPIDALVKTHQYLPPAKIPLYHGLALFPSRVQRAALHEALNRVLAVERRARWRETGRPHASASGKEHTKEDRWARGEKKASHAYVIFSDADTILRADTVPLAIALWRIRLWEGHGWPKKSEKTSAGGWKILMPKTLPA